MSQQRFNLNQISVAICLAFPALTLSAFAAEPYPALPPTLSSSVTPNIMLHIDNSGSMADSVNGKVKMTSAKSVAKAIVAANSNLRWGIFSFDTDANSTAGVLRLKIGPVIETVDMNAMENTIDGLSPETWTPLGEAMMEITRYFAGESSYYAKTKGISAGKYTSPIQYRCQKNFAIVITDGESTKDNILPGVDTAHPALSYRSYSASNIAESRTFKVCENNTNISPYITCPDVMEGSSTTANFISGSEYPRSLRDVVMYAYDRDFRIDDGSTAGKDLDGKSYDDVKFQKQNLITYTVGFAAPAAAKLLNAAAIVGRGKYYEVGSEAELLTSLQSAVDSIVASTSNAGGVATQSEITTAGNKVFQPVFNPSGWYGQLLCFSLNADGSVGPACTPNAEALIPAVTSRKVYSSNIAAGGSTSRFVFNDLTKLTTNQKNALGATDPERTNAMNFLRGTEGISGFRSRFNNTLNKTMLLGDIVDGQPVVISKPIGSTPDSSYPSFVDNNAARGIVLVGANDGMAHAFDISTMTELMGYIPQAVYPRLKALTALDYGQSAGTPHAYHVNGSMRQQDIKVGNAWKTIVVGGLGQGGQGYYGLDVTDATKMSDPATAIKWEFNDTKDSSLGYTLGTPVIYNVRTSATTVAPAVILANGYESAWDDVASGGQKTSSNESALYILNADTGALIKKIKVDNSKGLSSPAGLDYGQDGVLDFVYAGDVDGKLWRFDLTNSENFKVASNPIFDAGTGHPIVMRPGLIPANKAADGTALGNIILFGTGKLLTNLDRTDLTTQTLYGVLDKMEDSPTTVNVSRLQEQKFESTLYSKTSTRVGTYRKISASDDVANKFDLTSSANLALVSPKLGWYLNLPDPSERLVTSPMVFEDRVLFGTGVPVSTEKCLPGGSGWIIGLNPLTGSVTRKNNKSLGKDFSFVDISGDGRSSSADILGTGPISYISGYKKDGIPTELSYVSSAAVLTGPVDADTGLDNAGNVIALKEANSMAVFTGNGAAPLVGSTTSPTSRGHTIQRQASKPGCIYGGVIGKSDLDTDCMPPAPADNIRIETTVWREIK
jgi:type IV pilus assembly protein PilY1